MSGGGSKTQTVGYWYKYLQAFALSLGKLDAVLEFRAGGRTAWRGIVTQTSRIYVNALNLWGGQKKEGGLLGYMDLQMGDADQQPNDYLAAQLGSDQPSYRGKAMAIWRGGRWGAMNPYPKRAEFKVRRILQGWDNDTPWYPEKAEIPLLDGSVTLLGEGWEYKVETFSEPNTVWNDFTPPASGWQQGGELPFSTNGMSGGEYWTPARSNIWLRRQINVAASGITMNIAADNGCVVWVNGVNVGSSNPTNAPIGGNQENPVSYELAFNGVVDVVVKAFAEFSPEDDVGNVVTLSFTGLPLIAMNPSHVLYDSLTAADMQGEPTALLNDASFRAAADVLYDEGLGVCTTYDFEESIEEFQARILNVIGGSMTQSREDGQYYLDLIRPTEDPDTLPVISSDDIISLTLEPSTITEQVNQLTAEWFDVENNVARSTPPMQSRGAIHAAGQVSGESVEYPEIAAESLCLRLQARDLAAKSTPLTKVTVTTNRRGDLWKLRPGKKVRLQSAEDGVSDMIVVVGDIEYGTQRDGRLKIKGVQDVYSMPSTTYVMAQPNQGQPIYSPPVASPAQRLIEAPYVEVVANLSAADLAVFPDDSGVMMAMAIEPSSGLNYSLYSASAGTELAETGSGEWCPSALIVEAAGYLDASFTMTAGSGLELVEVGSWALWDEEIVRVDAIDQDALTVTLGRGCADTVPWKHDAGSRIWFCGDWAATDGAQYLDGDTVNAKLLTRTSIDELALESAALLSVEMDQRWFRPYPPAGLLINGVSYPEEVGGDLTLAWSDRDRVMQSDQLIDASVASIGPEVGTTYDLEIWDRDGEVLYHSETSVTSPAIVLNENVPYLARIEVWSVRGGLRSMQPASAEIVHGAALWTPAQMTGVVRAWLDDQSDVEEVSGYAASWSSRPGGGISFSQASVAKRPQIISDGLNGRRVLRFAGGQKLLSGASSIGRAVESVRIFAVYKNTSTATGYAGVVEIDRTLATYVRAGLMASDSGSGGRPTLISRRLDSDSLSKVVAPVAATGDWLMAMGSALYSERIERIELDGEVVAEETGWSGPGLSSDTDSVGAAIGGGNDSSGSYHALTGDVAVVIVLDGDLLDVPQEDVDRLFGWAAWRYGLVDNLPSGHPYKDAPPMVS